MSADSPTSYSNAPALIESVLHEDQNDTPLVLPLGAGERQIAITLLFLATLPSVVIPSLGKLWNKTTQFSLLLSLAFLVGLYFVIQYRFEWIFQLTHTLQKIYYERVRI